MEGNNETWYLNEHGDIFDESGKCLSARQTRTWKGRLGYALESLVRFYSQYNDGWTRLINEGTIPLQMLGYITKYITWPTLIAISSPMILPMFLADSKADLVYVRDDNRYRLKDPEDLSAAINRIYYDARNAL